MNIKENREKRRGRGNGGNLKRNGMCKGKGKKGKEAQREGGMGEGVKE